MQMRNEGGLSTKLDFTDDGLHLPLQVLTKPGVWLSWTIWAVAPTRLELYASQQGVQLTGIYSPRVWKSTLRRDALASPPGNKYFSVYKTLILKET